MLDIIHFGSLPRWLFIVHCPQFSIEGGNMGAPADEQITKYMECLKSELGELETCLQNRTTAKQLCIASKRVVLAAAELDEMILRCLASAQKAEPMRKIA